eukprot:CAMPEP_0113577976 /NCGR_PEP_ID=MMETSP0015_2-20120614/29195_1 /TAXON_ID=2838 /ORGANISM="Odontella" /LENGTH=285 /DNA_ID=CAMNT_0000481671 /DNA_START=96 /DNA_END=953 /DNA_ORIENTATION=+ /assembly_acc=CAM_ASM_000160
MKAASLVITLLCATSTFAFLSPRALNPINKAHAVQHPSDDGGSTTALHALKPPPLSSLLSRGKKKIWSKIEHIGYAEDTFEKRQRRREEFEELVDADFLQADFGAPKILVHERDFFRQATRMDAFDEYVLVSILCTSISYGALQTFQINSEHEGIFFYETILKTLIQVVATVATLCGLYATMVFSLSTLYGKTALGLERDSQYDVFLENTQEVRDKAFRSFSLSIVLFAIIVVLVLLEDLPSWIDLPVGCLLFGGVYVGYRDWKHLIDCATNIYDFMDMDEDEDD